MKDLVKMTCLVVLGGRVGQASLLEVLPELLSTSETCRAERSHCPCEVTFCGKFYLQRDFTAEESGSSDRGRLPNLTWVVATAKLNQQEPKGSAQERSKDYFGI